MSEGKKTTVITIDGPAGAGKSTVAKALARKLNFSYLDTGAMYRALTLKALRSNVNLEDEEQLVQLARQTSIELSGHRQESARVFLDGEDVTEEIRSLKVTNNTFYIARAPRVRKILVQWQRRIGERQDIVVEGRDAGTVIFPQATRKFYLDADFEERVSRRMKELKEKDKDIDKARLKEELRNRDAKDISRTAGPLKKASDAILIDSTHLTIDGVVEKMLGYIHR